MAFCPHCKSRLPFVKVVLLSPPKNSIQCPHCKTDLVADTKLLSVIGGIQGGAGGALICASLFLYKLELPIWAFTFICAVVTLSLSALIQNMRVKLKVKQ